MAKSLATSFTVEKESFDSSFQHSLINKDVALFVAELEGALIGYCLGNIHTTFYANGKVAWLEELFVSEKSRRSGAGKLLTQKFELWAKDSGAKRITLATRRAASFYSRLGYESSAEYFKKDLT